MSSVQTRVRTDRYETYEGGSPEAERLLFEQFAQEIMRIQARVRKRTGSAALGRTFHEKPALAVGNARLTVREDLPQELWAGFARPGAEYPVTVRMSSSSGRRRADIVPDTRGVALRIAAGDGSHDLLMVNSPVSHARDAREFATSVRILAAPGNDVGRAFAMHVRLPLAVGTAVAARMRRILHDGANRTVRSLALETYWSRAAILWGDAGPVRYQMRPAPGAPGAPAPDAADPDYLRHEITGRLLHGDVAFVLYVQRYTDQERTPVEDCSVEWDEAVAPPVPVATLVIPRQDLGTAQARTSADLIAALSFNPWFTTEEFRPLGSLNRARKAAYRASGDHRLGLRFLPDEPRHSAAACAAATAAFRAVNRVLPWYRLPKPLQVPNILFLRRTLSRANLMDTGVHEAPPRPVSPPAPPEEGLRVSRSCDGTYNDLSVSRMGAAGTSFGRNMAPAPVSDPSGAPNPHTVSDVLLERDAFLPARSLNLLAASWIQFQVHDWAAHRRCPPGGPTVEVPLPPGVTWRNTPGGPVETTMRFADDMRAGGGRGGAPVTFNDIASHWWDGSELYGGDEATARSLRGPDGSADIRLEDGYLPIGPGGVPLSGFTDNWWLGLSTVHTLFAREHNAVCAALRREYPAMDEERVHTTARLVVSALIAKIHVLEWTPAVLATDSLRHASRLQWHGPPRTWLGRLETWLLGADTVAGLRDRRPVHGPAPYSLTEEFVTVYRMHPLVPDDFEFCDHSDGRVTGVLSFDEVRGPAAEPVVRGTGLTDCLYSSGVTHPGAVTLRNYPRSLRRLQRDGEIIDLSVVDLVRDRRRGIPRYNDFRTGLHKPRARRFEDITSDPDALARLKDVYRSVDEIDTMVGLFAENPPTGFGFSDTAFRLFVLMASRRLHSDRFLTVDFRPEVYTPLGMDWVERGTLATVLLRHCPDLAPALPRDGSPFSPWRPVLPRS